MGASLDPDLKRRNLTPIVPLKTREQAALLNLDYELGQ